MYPENIQTITEKISQRRRQILVNSCIYYHMDENIWTDEQFDSFARELKQLVKDNPKEAKEAALAYDFEEWDKSDCLSGYGLPYSGGKVYQLALWMIESHKKFKGKSE